MKTTHLSNFKFHCPKCGNTDYEIDHFQVAGNSFFHNFLNKKFTIVSCTRCFFTEMYKIPFKKFEDVASFIKG